MQQKLSKTLKLFRFFPEQNKMSWILEILSCLSTPFRSSSQFTAGNIPPTSPSTIIRCVWLQQTTGSWDFSILPFTVKTISFVVEWDWKIFPMENEKIERENICRKFAQCSHMFMDFFLIFSSVLEISSQFDFSFSYDNTVVVCKFEGEGERARREESNGKKVTECRTWKLKMKRKQSGLNQMMSLTWAGEGCSKGGESFIDFHFHFQFDDGTLRSISRNLEEQ
jgi:hypothetical protein